MRHTTRIQNEIIHFSIGRNFLRTGQVACILTFGVLSGCANNAPKMENLAAQQLTKNEGAGSKDDQVPKNDKKRNQIPKQMAFTSMFDLLNCWPGNESKTPTDSAATNSETQSCGLATSQDVAGLYTRLQITSDWPRLRKSDGSIDDSVVPSVRTRRGVLQRALAGKTSTRILTLKANIADHGFATVVPLLSVGHVSNWQVGEQFDVLATDSSIEGPFFKIGTGTKLSVAVEARATTQYSSNMVKTVLGVAKRTVEYTAPQSSLLTSLTKERASVGATAMDEAIGKLTGDQEKEEVRADADISRWDASYHMRVYGRLPGENPDDLMMEGQWWVSLAIPRVSMFSSVEACKVADGPSKLDCAPKTVNEARKKAFGDNLFLPAVLGLSVADNVRLYDYLARQAWFGDAMGQLGGDDPVASKVANRFCANTIDSVYRLGLNHEDALATLYAVIKTRLDGKQVASIRKNCPGYVDQLKKLDLII